MIAKIDLKTQEEEKYMVKIIINDVAISCFSDGCLIKTYDRYWCSDKFSDTGVSKT